MSLEGLWSLYAIQRRLSLADHIARYPNTFPSDVCWYRNRMWWEERQKSKIGPGKNPWRHPARYRHVNWETDITKTVRAKVNDWTVEDYFADTGHWLVTWQDLANNRGLWRKLRP